MSYERNLTYLNNNRIVYRRLPITDIPDVEATYWYHYVEGTHECYDLFRSKAQITSYTILCRRSSCIAKDTKPLCLVHI